MLTGFMGAGKSTIGSLLAYALGWRFIDLDEEIVRAERKSIAAIFSQMGERHFRELEHRALAGVLQHTQTVIAVGGGAVETEANRQSIADSPETQLLYLEAPFDVLIARCEQQAARDSAAALRPVLALRAELTERYLRRKPFYEAAHRTIQTVGLDPEEIVETILKQWAHQPQRKL